LDDAWAARPLELVRERGRTMLVLKDPGGEPLHRLLGPAMGVERFLRLAVALSAALGRSHQRGLVHKDIKPTNFIVNSATGQAWLTDFGVAMLPEPVVGGAPMTKVGPLRGDETEPHASSPRLCRPPERCAVPREPVTFRSDIRRSRRYRSLRPTSYGTNGPRFRLRAGPALVPATIPCRQSRQRERDDGVAALSRPVSAE
jgi:serine/threonine protein kinase